MNIEKGIQTLGGLVEHSLYKGIIYHMQMISDTKYSIETRDNLKDQEMADLFIELYNI